MALIVTLVLAPFPPLLSPAKQTRQNAKEAYVATFGTNSPAPTIVARYTRGVSEPVVAKDTTSPVVSVVIGSSTVATLLAEDAVETGVAITSTPTGHSAHISTNAQANVAAALQVAQGTSASEVVEVGLDSSLNIAETVDTHGARTLAEYNQAGDPVKITAPDGTITYYAYDDDGNLTHTYSEKPKVLARAGENPLAYLSRVLTSSVRALAGEGSNERTAISYEEGALTEIDSGKSTVSFEYDASGNLASQQTDTGENIVYAYDEDGNIAGKEVRTPDNAIAHNAFTRTLARIGLGGLARSYARAYAGSETLAQSEAYGYDAGGELSAFSVSFGEDTATTQVSIPTTSPSTLPVSVPSPDAFTATSTSTTTVPVLESVPPATVTTPEATSTAEALVSFIAKPFKAITYALAPFMPRALADVLEEIATPTPDVTSPVALTQTSVAVWNTRDVLGNVAETQNQKGEITSYRYDSNTDAPTGRTVYNPEGAVLIDVSYGFDSRTNRWTSRSEGGVTESYKYDQNGGLAAVSGTNEASYRYDSQGNRVEESNAQGVTRYAYSGNRLTQTTLPDGTTRTYTYDELGNVESVMDGAKGTTRFSYGARGAVSRIELPDGTNIRYTYDALNRRVGKSVAGPSGSEDLTYRYEGANLTRVVSRDGTTLRQYLYDPQNHLIAIIAGGNTYSVVLDSHGSVIALTDQNSKVAAHFNYNAWGSPTSAVRTDLTDFYYASGFYEPLVGMYLLGPRTYDPSIGRFLQKDPLAGSLMDALSQNEYLYAGNDPVNRTDPTGHQSVEANVGSSPRALASQARAAAEEMNSVVDAARAQVALFTASSAPAEQLAVAQEAYKAAKDAQSEMITLARDNEARVEERETAARTALLLEQILPPIAAPATTTEATSTQTIMPLDVATSTAPVSELPTAEASTTVPISPVAPALPEVSAPVVPEQVPVVLPVPETVTTPTAPVTFIGATGQVVLSAFKDFAPHALAKKSKAKPAKKKSPPPPPKKSKAKSPPPPPKVTKQTKVVVAAKNVSNLSQSLAKLTSSLAALNKALAINKPVALPAVAKVTQATKVQVTKVAVAPQVPSTKKDMVSKLVSAPAGVKIAQVGAAFTSSVDAEMEKIARSIKAVQDKQAADKALATARATQLAADGKAKVMPVVNSQVVKNAQYGLAVCGFDPTATVGTLCGLADGFLYGLQGNGTNAGLSFIGVLPIVGYAGDVGKVGRLAEQGVKTVGRSSINITVEQIRHITSRHTVDGTANANASIFNQSTDIIKLIENAESVAPTIQSGGNYQRIVTGIKNIGIDRSTGVQTNTYTVITDAAGNLKTAFPGKP